jgi:hypothetical protein
VYFEHDRRWLDLRPDPRAELGRALGPAHGSPAWRVSADAGFRRTIAPDTGIARRFSWKPGWFARSGGHDRPGDVVGTGTQRRTESMTRSRTGV